MLRVTTYRTAGPGTSSSTIAVARNSAYVDDEGTASRYTAQSPCSGPTFDAGRPSTYPAIAMLLANVMDRTRGDATVRLAGPSGAL